MLPPSRFASAAHRLARARRWLLMGRRAPFLARYAPPDLPTPDPEEDGEGAARVWGVWQMAESLDEGLARLMSVRVEQGSGSLGIAQALAAVASEPDRDVATALIRSLARLTRAPALELGSAFARAVDLAAERGAPRVVSAPELQAARELLAITEEPVRDVLIWASRRAGKPRRAPLALADVLRVLRNESLDAIFRPVEDPWPALAGWRRTLGFELTAATEVAGEPEAWPGSWALKGRRSRLVGTAGWPGFQRARFALQGLGRLDVLSEGGQAALLPRDPAAVQVLAAVYPMLLGERSFLKRVFGSSGNAGPDADARRLAALSELLLQRTQAAVLHLWAAFDESRELAAVLETAGVVSRALHATVPPDLAILLAAPWADGLGALPSAAMTGAGLIESWREAFDEDFWRNPRFVETLRGLASRAPREAIGDLAPEAHASGPKAYARWVEGSLGG